MSDRQKSDPSEIPKNSMVNNIIEKSTTAIVEFALGYLNTVWLFFRWPFRRSPNILEQDKQNRVLPPYSFLFVNTSFLYFMSERFFRLLDFSLIRNEDKATLFPVFSPSNYSLESFVFNTAPIIITIAAISHVAAWLLGFRNNAVKPKVRSTVCYLSAYFLLLPSIATLLVGQVCVDIINSIAVPGKTHTEPGFLLTETGIWKSGIYLLYPMLIYFVFSIVMILISFTRATKETKDRGLMPITSFLTHLLGIFIFVIAGVSSSIVMTVYHLGGQLNLENYIQNKNAGLLKNKQLPCVAVVSNEKKSIEKNELPMSVAVTNNNEKSVLLFNFLSNDNVTLRFLDRKDREWKCRFAPLSEHEMFIEIKPGAVAILRGMLIPKDGQWRELLNNRVNMRMEIRFIGLYNSSKELFLVSVPDQVTERIYFVGFEKIPE